MLLVLGKSIQPTIDFIKICWAQTYGGDDLDVESPRDNQAATLKSNSQIDSQPNRDTTVQSNEQQGKPKKGVENSVSDLTAPSTLPACSEPHRSMGEILSSLDAERPSGKPTTSNVSAKRSAFWGKNTVSHSLSLPVEYCVACYPRRSMGVLEQLILSWSAVFFVGL